MSLTLGELARRFDVELKGNRDHVVVRVASLENAGADALAFLANPKFRKHLARVVSRRTLGEALNKATGGEAA